MYFLYVLSLFWLAIAFYSTTEIATVKVPTKDLLSVEKIIPILISTGELLTLPHSFSVERNSRSLLSLELDPHLACDRRRDFSGNLDRLPSTRLGGMLCLLINGQDTMLPSVPEEVDPLSVWIIELGLFRCSVEVTDHFVFDVCMQYVVSWGRVDELKICSFRVSSLQDDHIFLGQAEV